MIDPNLEIFVGDYITIRGSNNFYEVLKILPTKDAVIIQTVNDDVRVVHRPLIKGVISKEAMLQKAGEKGIMNMSDYERMSKPLKPCPFCGKEALMKVYNHVPTGYDYTPTCTDKSCAGRLSKRWHDINLAISAWNKRAEGSDKE